MNTLIKNGTLITASDTFKADILIEDEKIARIGTSTLRQAQGDASLSEDLEPGSAKVVDATGKLILPGGIDPHVHLDLPMFGTVSSDDHYTGQIGRAHV